MSQGSAELPSAQSEKRRHKFLTRKRLYGILLIAGIGTTCGLYLLFTSEWYFDQLLVKPGPFDRINFVPVNKTVGHGSLVHTPAGLVVMELNGTYAEMGYAHGVLLGEYIKYTIAYVLRVSESLATYRLAYDAIKQYLVQNETYHLLELEGILQGAVDAGVDRYVVDLKRNWDIIDLWLLNSIQDWYQAFCSGTGAWGASSETGHTLLSRTLDFCTDKNAYITQMPVIGFFRGDGSRNDVVSFTYPGMVAVLSGFNNHGVWVHVDSSNGPYTVTENRTAVGIALRNFLEWEDGSNVASDAQAYLENENLAASVLLLVGCNESVASPVFVLECRDAVVGYRGEESPTDDYVILTNHERVNAAPTECVRYARYLSDFQEYKNSGNDLISPDEIQLSQQHTGSWGSINVMQFFPHNLTCRVGYSRLPADFPDGGLWNNQDVTGAPWDPLMETWISYPTLGR